MSTGLAHFAVGGTLTALLVILLGPRIKWPRLAVVFGGAWAMFPDFWRVAPIYRDAFHGFHGSPWAELFWFHYTLDQHDPHDSKLFAFVILLVFFAITIVAETLNYSIVPRRREPEHRSET